MWTLKYRHVTGNDNISNRFRYIKQYVKQRAGEGDSLLEFMTTWYMPSSWGVTYHSSIQQID